MSFIKIYVWQQMHAYCESIDRVHHAMSRSDSPFLAD